MRQGISSRALQASVVLLSCTILSACGGLGEEGFEISYVGPPIIPDAEVYNRPPTTAGSNDEQVVWSQALDDEDVTGPLTFRLVQSAQDIKLTKPKTITNAPKVNDAGATLTVNVPVDPEAEETYTFSLKDPQLGVQNVVLTPDDDAPVLEATLPDGRLLRVVVESTDKSVSGAGEELNWTAYGAWNLGVPGSGAITATYYVTGAETPDSNIPTAGTATFEGFVQGTVYQSSGEDFKSASLHGDATITADFASGKINGAAPSITAVPFGIVHAGVMPAPGIPKAWNGLEFNGTMTSGINGFAGSTTTTSSPGGEYSVVTGAEGSFAGFFYGPAANELGAVWNVADNMTTATGVLVGKQ